LTATQSLFRDAEISCGASLIGAPLRGRLALTLKPRNAVAQLSDFGLWAHLTSLALKWARKVSKYGGEITGARYV
jgi:hypothetical protein